MGPLCGLRLGQNASLTINNNKNWTSRAKSEKAIITLTKNSKVINGLFHLYELYSIITGKTIVLFQFAVSNVLSCLYTDIVTTHLSASYGECCLFNSWDFFLVDFVVPWRTRRSWTDAWLWFSTETGPSFLSLSVVLVRCRRIQDLLVYKAFYFLYL